MTVLVTGANGHLGRATVHALLARGTDPSEVVATARDTTSIKDLADLGVETRRADYDDRASLDAALTGVDRVLLVSGTALGQRVAQHTRVIEAAAAAAVDLVVYTSSPHAETATYLLAQEHRGTERVLAASGVPYAVLRNGWYLENYTGTAAQSVELGTVLGAAGAGRVSAAARHDFAEAAAVVLVGEGHAGQIYELGGDEGFTKSDFAIALSAASGREVTYTDLPASEYAAALESAGLPGPYAQVIADSDEAIARGELYDGSRTLSRLIGRPTTPLDDAVRLALA